MLQAVKAVVDNAGHVQLLEKIKIKGVHHAVVTILDDLVEDEQVLKLSEATLIKDWDRPEEEEAWKHLQRVR
jgi:hypothetical protein